MYCTYVPLYTSKISFSNVSAPLRLKNENRQVSEYLTDTPTKLKGLLNRDLRASGGRYGPTP